MKGFVELTFGMNSQRIISVSSIASVVSKASGSELTLHTKDMFGKHEVLNCAEDYHTVKRKIEEATKP